MESPITIAVIALTCLVSFIGFNRPGLVDRLLLWPPAVARGEGWRLASYGFVHADLAHLAFNMITLWFFGRVMEQLIGGIVSPAGYLAFYLGGLVVSILPSWLRHRNDPEYRSLGASGAVSAVLFAYILVDPWAMLIVFVVPMPAILYAVLYTGYSIWMDRARRDNVNHSAHLWGAAYGVIFLIVAAPRVVPHFLERLVNPGG